MPRPFAPLAALVAVAVTSGGLSARALAQGLPPAAGAVVVDTLPPLSEVVITGAAERPVATVQRLDPREVALADAPAVAALAPLVPGATLTTNSRGETLLYLRGSGERQTAVLFDGALLTVPWDNRIDLSLVPAAALDGMTVAKGAAALEYGPNVSGGVVNLVPLTAGRTRARLGAYVGSDGTLGGSAAGAVREGRVGVVAAVSHAQTDGQAVPAGAELPFSQAPDALRTNTDLRTTSVLVRLSADAGPRANAARTRVSLTLLGADGEKGVAPEAQLDPARTSPRYWRYPSLSHALVIGAAETSGRLGGRPLGVRATVWGGRFAQSIDQYASAAYERRTARQDDHDGTAGVRASVRLDATDALALRLAATAVQSHHRQFDRTVSAAGVVSSPDPMDYAQRTASAGLTAEAQLAPRLRAEAGAGLDGVAFLRTADKPARDGLVAPSLSLGVRYDGVPAEWAWHVRAAAGRKTRFPTMRELFGEALRRFQLNPDLRPETSTLVEVGAGLAGPRLWLEAVPFATFTDGTIDQEVVAVNGQNKRRRVNLRGSRVLGVEVAGGVRLAPALRLTGHVAAMDVRRLQDTPDGPDRLTERPDATARLGLVYEGLGPFSLLAEAVHTGRAYSLAPDGGLATLPTSTLVNVRLGARLPLGAAAQAEAYVRADNLADAVSVPQLGLPGPGRSFRVGVAASF